MTTEFVTHEDRRQPGGLTMRTSWRITGCLVGLWAVLLGPVQAQGERSGSAANKAPATQARTGADLALSAGDACGRDLEAIPPFLMENDAGARDLLTQRGEPALAAALLRARADAAQIADDRACLTLLTNYLKLWRKGHLWVSASPAAEGATVPTATAAETSAPVRLPQLRVLSSRTILLHLPSFSPPQRAALETLMRKQRSVLLSHPNWIIDVRDNDGGADGSYAPLLPWLLAERPVSVGVEWLATPANLRAHEQICPRYAPGDAACVEFAQSVLASLHAVPTGSWARVQADRFVYEPGQLAEKRRPQKVAVLMDKDCGSACEQFLLTVRQGFGVKLLGRPSYGALDYSNMRPFALPSGRRELWYATSRSLRLPQLPVDTLGVLPDILLPELQSSADAQAEVLATQRWLEGGSLQRAATAKP